MKGMPGMLQALSLAALALGVNAGCAHNAQRAIETNQRSRQQIAGAFEQEARRFGVEVRPENLLFYSDGKSFVASQPLTAAGSLGAPELANGADVALEYLDLPAQIGLPPGFYRVRVSGAGGTAVADLFNSGGAKVRSFPASIAPPQACPSTPPLILLFPEDQGFPVLAVPPFREYCWLLPLNKRESCVGACCLCASFFLAEPQSDRLVIAGTPECSFTTAGRGVRVTVRNEGTSASAAAVVDIEYPGGRLAKPIGPIAPAETAHVDFLLENERCPCDFTVRVLNPPTERPRRVYATATGTCAR